MENGLSTMWPQSVRDSGSEADRWAKTWTQQFVHLDHPSIHYLVSLVFGLPTPGICDRKHQHLVRHIFSLPGLLSAIGSISISCPSIRYLFHHIFSLPGLALMLPIADVRPGKAENVAKKIPNRGVVQQIKKE